MHHLWGTCETPNDRHIYIYTMCDQLRTATATRSQILLQIGLRLINHPSCCHLRPWPLRIMTLMSSMTPMTLVGPRKKKHGGRRCRKRSSHFPMYARAGVVILVSLVSRMSQVLGQWQGCWLQLASSYKEVKNNKLWRPSRVSKQRTLQKHLWILAHFFLPEK